MAQSITAARRGLLAACQTIYEGQVGPAGDPVLVILGAPGINAPSAVVAICSKPGSTRQPVDRPTMGTNRSREKTVEFEITINTWIGGTEVIQQDVIEKIDELSELLEAYFRAFGQETLGGGCREAFVSNIDGPDPEPTWDPETEALSGWQAESTVTVTAYIRQ